MAQTEAIIESFFENTPRGVNSDQHLCEKCFIHYTSNIGTDGLYICESCQKQNK